MQTPDTSKQKKPSRGLIEHVELRRAELTRVLAAPTTSTQTRADVEAALAALAAMLTGDPANVSPVAGRELSRWIAVNKHLGLEAKPAAAPPVVANDVT